MSQSLAQIYLHFVFSTKDRKPFVQTKDLRDEMHKYVGGICRNLESPSLIIGGVEDHVHILCRFGRKQSIADFIRDLKRDSSKWIKTREPSLAEFEWQSGYGAFSISPSHVDALRRYIANQEAHHQKVSFQDEFRRLCQKYGIEIDERYVWD